MGMVLTISQGSRGLKTMERDQNDRNLLKLMNPSLLLQLELHSQ
jgi:hypothetical protein